MSSSSTGRTKVFISYCHKDAEWLARLEVHLKPMTRSGEITLWSDSEINPGSNWKEEILKAIDATRVAILLVSADFLASDFITDDELPRLLAAASKGGAVILPVILSPCRFLKTKGISEFQAVNDPARPLISMTKAEQEEAFVKITEKVEKSFNMSQHDSSTQDQNRICSKTDNPDMKSRVREIIARFPDLRSRAKE